MLVTIHQEENLQHKVSLHGLHNSSATEKKWVTLFLESSRLEAVQLEI